MNGSFAIASEPGSSEINFITAVPTGKQLKGTEYEQVFKALNYFNFDNVMSASKAGDINVRFI